MERLGCFGWLMLVALCAAPFYLLGASDNVAALGGLILSSVIMVALAAYNSYLKQQQMYQATREAIRDENTNASA